MNKKSKLIGLILTFAVVGCDLEVNNPNSLLEDDLKDPSAAVSYTHLTLPTNA